MDDSAIVVETRNWRPIHYLGSKLRLADQIREILRQADPRQRPVCDLFAGSGTVAASLATSRDVVAADIQEYSRVLCSAVLQPLSLSCAQIANRIESVRGSRFYRDLEWAVEPLILEERKALELARSGDPASICRLVDCSPIGFPSKRDNELRAAFQEVEHRLRVRQLHQGPQSIFLRHFGGIYFSYLQAVQLSALLTYAHSQGGQRRDVFLAAALSAASDVVNTVGRQFAQPLQLRDVNGVPKRHLLKKILRDRVSDIFSGYAKWLAQYCSMPATERAHTAIRSDFGATLDQHCDNVGIVYADPPYTRDHYSRYYHVLETMCLFDEPDISVSGEDDKKMPLRGIYRADRHQSPFCIKSQAPAAFAEMFSKAKRLDVPIAVSYSPLPSSSKPRPRVMAVEDVSEIARRYFRNVDRVTIGGIHHSKLNAVRLNSESSPDAEILLICH